MSAVTSSLKPSDNSNEDPIAIALFSEVLASEQLMRGRLSRSLPKGMELSHFIMLNYLSRQTKERTPAQLARVFHLTKGAMTNTLGKLESYGYIHIRPDWDDARRKLVAISNAGDRARDEAVLAITPIFEDVMGSLNPNTLREGLRFLREFRTALED
ncbi:MarR family transcriptional regulator [Amylibacter marinus]|uniref:MarR family transcriptional regulator n=1 Tax=Amylibacter marinus TaxID=1475483 RepID=A0ABQ5VWU1_9RHOB|nr:MarR family transcriptional regulator [Amylibacter marinus]GLQ35563.1 MarR family transcriptional regulator [Amylibacter marinus]